MLIERWPHKPERRDVLRVASEITSERWPAIVACPASMDWLALGEVEHLLVHHACPLWPANAGTLTAVEAIRRLDDWKRDTAFYGEQC